MWAFTAGTANLWLGPKTLNAAHKAMLGWDLYAGYTLYRLIL